MKKFLLLSLILATVPSLAFADAIYDGIRVNKETLFFKPHKTVKVKKRSKKSEPKLDYSVKIYQNLGDGRVVLLGSDKDLQSSNPGVSQSTIAAQSYPIFKTSDLFPNGFDNAAKSGK